MLRSWGLAVSFSDVLAFFAWGRGGGDLGVGVGPCGVGGFWGGFWPKPYTNPFGVLWRLFEFRGGPRLERSKR